MTVNFTNNFFAKARGLTFEDSASVTWSFDQTTNELTATGSGGGGSTPYPTTLPNLQYWFDASLINADAGGAVPAAQNLSPAFSALTPLSISAQPPVVSSSQLNAKNTVTFNSTASQAYNCNTLESAGGANTGFFLPSSTGFFVFNSAGISVNQSLICGGSNSLGFGINSSALYLTLAFVGTIGASTAPLLSNTWYQVNYTYNSVTGVYSFRVAQTGAGSGTQTATVSAVTSGLGWTTGYGQYFNGALAEAIVYDRVLTNTEITTMETYLNTKWGV